MTKIGTTGAMAGRTCLSTNCGISPRVSFATGKSIRRTTTTPTGEDDGGGEGRVDSVYGGSCRLDLSPYFKKRGWCYERETRLVVTLREGVDLPMRLAVRFCGPFDELERQMKGSRRERNLLSGPWFDDRSSSPMKVKGVGIREIGKSDYANEIKIITG